MNCPKCKKPAIKSGLFSYEYMDIVDRAPVRRGAFRQRYACRDCGVTWSDRSGMHPTRNMSERFAAWIRKQSQTRSNLDIARECGLDEGTVRRLIAENSK